MERQTQLVVNLGGEGEVPGALNVNTLTFAIRSAEAIKRRGPLLQADVRAVPLRDECADEVVGNRLPLDATDDWAGLICREAYRILKPGGFARLNSHSGALPWMTWLTGAGFVNVGTKAGYAIGLKGNV